MYIVHIIAGLLKKGFSKSFLTLKVNKPKTRTNFKKPFEGFVTLLIHLHLTLEVLGQYFLVIRCIYFHNLTYVKSGRKVVESILLIHLNTFKRNSDMVYLILKGASLYLLSTTQYQRVIGKVWAQTYCFPEMVKNGHLYFSLNLHRIVYTYVTRV